jgi:hypothetical protein
MIISPEISTTAVTGGNSLYQYANSLSAIYPIQNQFTKPCGLSYTQGSTVQLNEFLTLARANALYSGGGGTPSQIIDSGSNNSVTCTASNPGIVITNLQNTNTGV